MTTKDGFVGGEIATEVGKRRENGGKRSRETNERKRRKTNERKGEKVAAVKETANWDGRREKGEGIGMEQNLFCSRTSCCGYQAKTGLFVSFLFP